MLKQKHTGFTLIELLVVIVIIGILATISTATFRGYFGQARDAVRQSTVENIALMIKVDRATTETSPYAGLDATAVGTLLTDNDFDMPVNVRQDDTSNSGYYVYLDSSAPVDDFLVYTCAEDAGAYYEAGTTAAVDTAALDTQMAANCAATELDPTAVGQAVTGYSAFELN